MKHLKYFESVNFIYSYTWNNSEDAHDAIYYFTNKYDTEYVLQFQDQLFMFETKQYKFDYTNEHDVVNVMNTVTTIISDYLLHYNEEDLYIDNMHSDKEHNKIKEEYPEDFFNKSHKIINKRTILMSEYLRKNLPKNYKFKPIRININMLHIYKK
jgi:hypothetical protein